LKRGTPDHPKTHELAAVLGLERWGAVGVLESLFHFAAQYARRGDIGRHTDAAIARGIGWTGDAGGLVEALVKAGWLDRCRCHRLRIHDWHDHADQTVSRAVEVKTSGFIACYQDASATLAPDEREASQPLPLPLPTPLPEPEPTPLPCVQSLPEPVEKSDGNGNGTAPGTSRGIRREDRPTYAEAVWETFRQRYQPGRLTMTSAEFHLVSAWMDQSIPLPIVERGIAETGGKPRTLLACEEPVKRAHAYWLQAIGGLPSGTEDYTRRPGEGA
jgi:hypothetical protein